MGSEAQALRWSTWTPFPESFYASLSCSPTTSSCPLPASSSLSLPCTLILKVEDDHESGLRRCKESRQIHWVVGSSDLVSLDFLFKCFATVVGIYSGFEVGIEGGIAIVVGIRNGFEVGRFFPFPWLVVFGCAEKDWELGEAQAAPRVTTKPMTDLPQSKPTDGFLFTSFFGCWLLISISLSFVNNVAGCFEIVGLLVKIGSQFWVVMRLLILI